MIEKIKGKEEREEDKKERNLSFPGETGTF